MAHHLKDLTIELDEKVGSVAAAAEALGKAGVNIEGICGFVVGGKGVGHVLVADSAKARQALQSAGARVTGEQDALVLDIEDKPGALGLLTRKIANAGVSPSNGRPGREYSIRHRPFGRCDLCGRERK